LADSPSVNSDEAADGAVPDFDSDGALSGIDVQHAGLKANIHSVVISHFPLTDLPDDQSQD
jgi:hypothetical protein